MFQLSSKFDVVFPTPFRKKPFEFIVGFRRSLFLFTAAYGIMFASIYVHNLNLGIFALCLNYLIILGFYIKPENDFFVWSFSDNPSVFLFKKIKTALKYSCMLCFPMVLILSVFYSENMVLFTLIFLVGWAYLVAIVLAKYAAFPDEMDIKEGMLIAISISIPPLLVGVIPYFYLKAKKQLQKYLS